MKYENEYDEYVHHEAADFFNGDVQSPSGAFAALDLGESDGEAINAHYGHPWLLILEDNDGFVTVHVFESKEERDRSFDALYDSYQHWASND